jgi:hypothetical protein
MAAAQPVAALFPAPVPGRIRNDVQKGRKKPENEADTSGQWYRKGDVISIICYTAINTTPVVVVIGEKSDSSS